MLVLSDACAQPLQSKQWPAMQNAPSLALFRGFRVQGVLSLAKTLISNDVTWRIPLLVSPISDSFRISYIR